ncbi:MAG: hypothetical protein JKY34_14710 [Kordiimonadaceae bacterium]|nr:hypothetical protein [Kordiimonadaceae bacterium]
MPNNNAVSLTRDELGEAFVRALDNIKGDPLHDYWIDLVLALSSDYAKELFDGMEESDSPPWRYDS